MLGSLLRSVLVRALLRTELMEDGRFETGFEVEGLENSWCWAGFEMSGRVFCCTVADYQLFSAWWYGRCRAGGETGRAEVPSDPLRGLLPRPPVSKLAVYLPPVRFFYIHHTA